MASDFKNGIILIHVILLIGTKKYHVTGIQNMQIIKINYRDCMGWPKSQIEWLSRLKN